MLPPRCRGFSRARPRRDRRGGVARAGARRTATTELSHPNAAHVSETDHDRSLEPAIAPREPTLPFGLKHRSLTGDLSTSRSSNAFRSNETAEKRRSMLFYSYFKTLVGKQITVELKNDLAIGGTLVSVDQYLNIKLENTKVVDENRYPHMRSVRNCFIRGSVVRYVQLPAEAVDVDILHDATRREARGA